LEGVSEAVAGADGVVSCAHARYTKAILKACRPKTKVVLMGSAWRFSRVPNPRADEVRAAEELFLASGNPGVMLHSTMIYGGFQERNVQQLLSVLGRFPVVPIPGGGRQVVRPIYIDDLVECLFASVGKTWEKPMAFAVAGPAMTWRDMAMSCAEAKGLRRLFVAVPISPAIKLLELIEHLGVKAPSPDILPRFAESADFSTQEMKSLLGVDTRSFNSGIKLAIQSWNTTIGS
jgi:uncharacterized protein YbjT (DUF2867 family)